MTRTLAWGAVVIATLMLAGSPAAAQPIYGGGYWGGYAAGGETAQGSIAKGMGMYAMGAGQYNLATAQANAINANTAMQWNEYIYQSRLESSRQYHAKLARDRARAEKSAEAIRARLRDHPNSVDIANGDALNVVLDELTDPKVYPRAVDYGHKTKIGGDMIRDIPFTYASAAITVSVNQLTHGGAPPVLLNREEFAPGREALRAIAAELWKEVEETGAPRPETIRKAKERVLATKARIEAILPKGSADRQAADKYIKALYAFVRMMETPAVDVLLAGVERHPEATLGDLLGFMTAYNLRFGVAETPRQREVYQKLYPMLVRLRDQVAPAPATTPRPASVGAEAPAAAFDGVSYDRLDGKVPAAPGPRPPG